MSHTEIIHAEPFGDLVCTFHEVSGKWSGKFTAPAARHLIDAVGATLLEVKEVAEADAKAFEDMVKDYYIPRLYRNLQVTLEVDRAKEIIDHVEKLKTMTVLKVDPLEVMKAAQQ